MRVIVCVLLFAFLYFIEKGYIWFARRKRIEDNPGARSSHSVVIVRGGGIIFYVAMLAFFIYAGFPFPYFFTGLTMLSFISFVDDLHSLSPKTRLVCQVVALAFMVNQISSSSIGIILALIVLSATVVNLVNFMDGINGMLSGMSLIVLGTLQYVNFEIIHFIEPELIWTLLIADFTFCLFNFKSKADCFAGDVGSMAMGFILFYLIIKLVWVSDDFKWFVLLSVFLTDGGLTIVHRIFLRDNILLPHRKHAYEIMANELKIPHIRVSAFYMLVQMVINIWYILIPTMVTFVAICVILIGSYLGFMLKFYHLHEESLAQNKDIVVRLEGKTVIVVGRIAKKNVGRYVKEKDKVNIVELEEWDDEAVKKYKPTLILFE